MRTSSSVRGDLRVRRKHWAWNFGPVVRKRLSVKFLGSRPENEDLTCNVGCSLINYDMGELVTGFETWYRDEKLTQNQQRSESSNHSVIVSVLEPPSCAEIYYSTSYFFLGKSFSSYLSCWLRFPFLKTDKSLKILTSIKIDRGEERTESQASDERSNFEKKPRWTNITNAWSANSPDTINARFSMANSSITFFLLSPAKPTESLFFPSDFVNGKRHQPMAMLSRSPLFKMGLRRGRW